MEPRPVRKRQCIEAPSEILSPSEQRIRIETQQNHNMQKSQILKVCDLLSLASYDIKELLQALIYAAPDTYYSVYREQLSRLGLTPPESSDFFNFIGKTVNAALEQTMQDMACIHPSIKMFWRPLKKTS